MVTPSAQISIPDIRPTSPILLRSQLRVPQYQLTPTPHQSPQFQDMISILLLTLLLLAKEVFVKAAPDAICPADADMYKECRASICSLIRASPEKGPTFVRLAWHASGTYTKMTNKGGSYNGTIRFYEEFSRGANNGLQTAMGWLNEIWLYVRQFSFRHLAYNTDTSA